ncbi:MAG TPA: hypothetical protein VFN91_17950 [Myxococcaceae bacterium]|nr:hypothetical protein [Myxococcaceae bacterium]
MKQVYMYTLSTCPSYTDFDVAKKATQTKILAEMEAAGVSGFPYVRIGDDVVQGYKPARFRELLGLEDPGGTSKKA